MEGTREDRGFVRATPLLSPGSDAAEAAPFQSRALSNQIDGYLRYL
jgi:hypothetical protein